MLLSEVQLNSRLSSEIERHCGVNGLDISDYVNMILNSGFAADRYGSSPSFLQEKPRRDNESGMNHYEISIPKAGCNSYDVSLTCIKEWKDKSRDGERLQPNAERLQVNSQKVATKSSEKRAEGNGSIVGGTLKRKTIKRTLESL